MLAEHPPKNAQMIEAARIGEVQGKMIAIEVLHYLLGLTKQGVQMEGAASIRGKDNKCVGTLSGEQTLGMNYVIGKKLEVSLLFVKRISSLHMKFISCVERSKCLLKMLQNRSLIFICPQKAY